MGHPGQRNLVCQKGQLKLWFPIYSIYYHKTTGQQLLHLCFLLHRSWLITDVTPSSPTSLTTMISSWRSSPILMVSHTPTATWVWYLEDFTLKANLNFNQIVPISCVIQLFGWLRTACGVKPENQIQALAVLALTPTGTGKLALEVRCSFVWDIGVLMYLYCTSQWYVIFF